MGRGGEIRGMVTATRRKVLVARERRDGDVWKGCGGEGGRA